MKSRLQRRCSSSASAPSSAARTPGSEAATELVEAGGRALPAPSSPGAAVPGERLAIGTVLSHYRVLRRLGAGAMGEVYAAEDTELERSVALKLLPTALASRPDRLARFQREARAVAALNHRNIVTIYSIEAAAGQHFLTMELVEGETLDRLIPAQGMPVLEVLQLAIALAEALTAAHAQGVVHRDLKPSNVMVDRHGRLKVLDFGLAKVGTTSETASDPGLSIEVPGGNDLSRAGAVVGTVPYMSPEQAAGRSIDDRSDIFSLGVLLYEMSSGRHPFPGATSAPGIPTVLRHRPAPLTEIRADLPGELARIVGRCLEREPQDRFSSARELREALRSLRQEFTSSALETELRRLRARFRTVDLEPAVRVRSAASVRRWRAVAAAALLALAVGGAMGALPGRTASLTPRSTALPGASLVTLPTQVLGAPADGYLAQTVTLALSSRLSRVQGPAKATSRRQPASGFVVSSLGFLGGHAFLGVQVVEADTRSVAWSCQIEDTPQRVPELALRAAHELESWLAAGSPARLSGMR